MAKRVADPLPSELKPPAKWQKVELTVGPSRDVPMLSANNVIVNFTGHQFLLTVLAAFPEPWTRSDPRITKKVEARVLARYAFSVSEWVPIAKSIIEQIQRLQEQRVLTIEDMTTEDQHET